MGVYAVVRTYMDVGDLTYNLSPIFREALGCPLQELHGRRAGDVTDQLARAVVRLRAEPITFRALEPDNGWGTAAGAAAFLADLLRTCEEFPDGEVYAQ